MAPSLRFALLLALVIAIGIFHHFMKPYPEENEIRDLGEMFNRPAKWLGRPAPDIEMELMDGSHFRMADHIGKRVVIINFFTTWCPPCRAEMPELEKFASARRDEFLFIGIDVKEDADEVGQFLDELKITFPVGLDRDGDISDSFGVKSFPTTVLIGVDGSIQAYEVGLIRNADAAFSFPLELNRKALEAGDRTTEAEWREKLARDSRGRRKDSGDKKNAEKLEGRARQIAEMMRCPCGCKDDSVLDCGCSTADAIKEELKTMDLRGISNEEAVRKLNDKFCVTKEEKNDPRGA